MPARMRYDKIFSENNDNPFGRVFRLIEHKKVLELLKPEESDRILEVGCNSGNFVKTLKKHCDNVTGVDINEDAIKSSSVENLFCMSAEELVFRDDSFNKIVSMHTIEHVPDFKKALHEMGRVVKKGGRIVLSYPLEPVRGLTALPTACFIYRNPAMCRQLHLHKLNLGKISQAIKSTRLSLSFHKVFFTPWPTYLTVLEKVV